MHVFHLAYYYNYLTTCENIMQKLPPQPSSPNRNFCSPMALGTIHHTKETLQCRYIISYSRNGYGKINCVLNFNISMNY